MRLVSSRRRVMPVFQCLLLVVVCAVLAAQKGEEEIVDSKVTSTNHDLAKKRKYSARKMCVESPAPCTQKLKKRKPITEQVCEVVEVRTVYMAELATATGREEARKEIQWICLRGIEIMQLGQTPDQTADLIIWYMGAVANRVRFNDSL